MIEASIITALWLVYALLFPGFKTKTRAERNALVWWYPTERARDNYPPAQRVHEGGGFRLASLIAAPFAFGAMLLVGYIGLAWHWYATVFLAAVFAPYYALRLWIDIAEHEAEIRFAEAAGFTDYRLAELVRMSKSKDYLNWSLKNIEAALARVNWRARAILFLARW